MRRSLPENELRTFFKIPRFGVRELGRKQDLSRGHLGRVENGRVENVFGRVENILVPMRQSFPENENPTSFKIPRFGVRELGRKQELSLGQLGRVENLKLRTCVS